MSLDIGGLPHDPQQIKKMMRACMAYYECKVPVRMKFAYSPRRKRLWVKNVGGTLVLFGPKHREHGVPREQMAECIEWAVIWAMRMAFKPTKSAPWAQAMELTVEAQKQDLTLTPEKQYNQRMAAIIEKRKAAREREVARAQAAIASHEWALAKARKKLKAAQRSLEGYAKRGNKYLEQELAEEALADRVRRKANSLLPGKMPDTVSLENETPGTGTEERDV